MDKHYKKIQKYLPDRQYQIYASKYMLYIPTEEELSREISLERENLENMEK